MMMVPILVAGLNKKFKIKAKIFNLDFGLFILNYHILFIYI